MNLFTKIITSNSSFTNKQISCHFNHPFEIINTKLSTAKVNTTSDRDITNYLLQRHFDSINRQKCFIVYKMQFDLKILKQYLQQNYQITAKIFQYNPIDKKLQLKILIPGQQTYEFTSRDQRTIILELSSQSFNTKIYFLPHNNGEQLLIQINRAVQQNLKFLRALNQYIKLQDCFQEQILISQPFILDLKEYLYLKQIKYFQFLVFPEKESKFDLRMIQKIGQLKMPEQWLQKEVYRHKKLQLYQLKLEESKLMNDFRPKKIQFTKKINYLLQISGILPQQYEQITIQTLKDIKNKNPLHNILQIKQNENILKNLEQKLKELSCKKTEYLQKMSDIQKKHVDEISGIKKQIIGLQNTKQNVNKMKSGLIFLKTQKFTEHQLINSYFVNNDKKVDQIRIKEAQKTKKQLNYELNLTLPTSEDRSVRKHKEPVQKSTHELRKNERKKANVVKEDFQSKTNKALIRERYQQQMMRVEFQIEIKNDQMRNRFKEGCSFIQKLLQQNHQVSI